MNELDTGTPAPQTISIPLADQPTGADQVAPPRPAAAGSALADMRERRERLLRGLYIDLEVPRWADDGGPSIWVRYGPLPPGFAPAAAERRSKQKGTLGDEWIDYANCDVLIKCCIGVYAKDGEETYSLKPDDPYGEWTKFDPDLAACLGIDTGRAVDVVRKLYFTGDDRTMAVTQLMNWGAQESSQVEKVAEGN